MWIIDGFESCRNKVYGFLPLIYFFKIKLRLISRTLVV